MSIEKYPEFVWIPDFIILTGSTIYGKDAPHDVDIVVRIPEPIFSSIMEHSRDIFDALSLKLRRIFNRPVHFVPTSTGNNWDGIGLYDLVLRAKEPNGISIDEDEFRDIFYSTDDFAEYIPSKIPFCSSAGKFFSAKYIIPYIPEHEIYVEPFCGSASVFFKKPRSLAEVLNDINSGITFSLKFIQKITEEDIEKLKKFDWVLRRKKFFDILDRFNKNQFSKDELTRFYEYLYLVLGSYCGNLTSIGVKRIGKSIKSDFNKFLKLKDRLQGVKITSKDFRDVIKEYDTKDTFFFIDPPYVNSTNMGMFPKKIRNEFTQADLNDLIKLCKNLRGKFILTLENCKSSRDLCRGFNVKKFDRFTIFHGRGIPTTEEEIMVSNFPFKKNNWAGIDGDDEEFLELRSATPEIEEQAKISMLEDKIEFGRFFYPEKTSLPAVMLLKGKGIEPAIDWVVKNKPVIVNKKYDGNRLIIMVDKKNKKIEIYSEDGRKLPENKLPETTKQLLELNGDSFILDCECEMWLNGKHQNREDVAGFLHNKIDFDDKGIVLNVFDILYYNGKDIHKLSYTDRLHYLFKLKIKQSTLNEPKPEYHINQVPSFVADTKEKAIELINLCANAPASEGAMLKKAFSPYSINGYSDNWLKVKKYETLKVIVLKVNSTKVPSVVNFDIGIRFRDRNIAPNRIVELDGKKYMKIGKTFNTTKDYAKVGDIISVLFHTVNWYKTKDGEYLHLYEPIIDEKHPEEAEPDYFESVVEKAKISNLLVEKFIEDLNNYNPKSVPDEVLIDDYRWLLVFINNEIHKYNLKLIKDKLDEVIDEIFRRGIATLHPDRYNDKMREIVIDIVKKKTEGLRSIPYSSMQELLRKNILLSRASLDTGSIIKVVGENKLVILKVLEEITNED